MMEEEIEIDGDKSELFQVLLLHDDDFVEVKEARKIDFIEVRNHLLIGGSVFITSKTSQKLRVPKRADYTYRNTNEIKTIATFFIDQI
ncbi:MAG: hypothetical protein NWE84_09445 [Candidatus Bathyarchaeota archaeon]|nr:hypothetical protein [Candidatus Bathyarchaeota archaeon]